MLADATRCRRTAAGLCLFGAPLLLLLADLLLLAGLTVLRQSDREWERPPRRSETGVPPAGP
jgi:hypothetical protein